MYQDKIIDEFEAEVIPKIREDLVKVLNYFEEQKLPSAYASCVQMYVANFLASNPKTWAEHCDDYGISIEFKEISSAIAKIKSLDAYVEDFS